MVAHISGKPEFYIVVSGKGTTFQSKFPRRASHISWNARRRVQFMNLIEIKNLFDLDPCRKIPELSTGGKKKVSIIGLPPSLA